MKKIGFLLLLLILFSRLLSIERIAMTLEFDTTLSDGTEIALPLYGTLDVFVDWG